MGSFAEQDSKIGVGRALLPRRPAGRGRAVGDIAKRHASGVGNGPIEPVHNLTGRVEGPPG